MNMIKHVALKHCPPPAALSFWANGKLIQKGKPWKPCAKKSCPWAGVVGIGGQKKS